MTTFKDFKVADVLFVEQTQSVIAKENLIDGPIPYITRTTFNNGHARTCGNTDKINDGNCITIGAEGGVAFYQPDDFVAGNKVYRLSRPGLNEKHYLYLAALLNKKADDYSYSNARIPAKIKNETISLPVISIENPDFDTLNHLLCTPPALQADGGVDMSKIDTSGWKEFKVSDVFGKAILGKYHSPESLIRDDSGYPYICASNQNNGINKDMPRVNGENLSLTPPQIISWGKQCPMFCYHSEPCVTSQGMYYLDMTGYTEAICLFICAELTHVCADKYSYTNCLIGSKMDEITILLPCKEEYVPDWDYMQERIAELEQERIAELDAYLKVTGLENYELTMDEEMALRGYFDGTTSFRNFKVQELFDIHPTATYKMNNDDLFGTNGNTPVLSNSSANNGIAGYCGLPPTEVGNIITFSDTTTGADTMFFQENPFIGYSHVQGMYPKGFELDRHKAEFFISLIRKASGNGFDYANKFRRDIVRDLVISLPIKSDGSINWEYIYIYIRAMEKKTVENLARWRWKEMNMLKSFA